MTHVYSRYLAAAALWLLAGCAVGPNFKAPPTPPVAGLGPAGPMAGDAQHFVAGLDIPGQWWTLFESAELNALIAQALKNSPTLEAAQASLRQANENLAAQRGSFAPSVSGSVQAQRAKASGAAFGNPQAGSVLYTLNSASVNVSYALDAFGGIRRQVESLQAQADYRQFALEATYLSLTANIVTAAILEASLRAQVLATERIAQSQGTQLGITQRRVDSGGASRADTLQQQATLQGTLAVLPVLRSQLAQARNQLATYVGVLPGDFTGAAIHLDDLTLPADLPLSLPSKFVAQRPDVRQYSALLHQATAQIGVATANLLPQVALTAGYGGQARKFADLFSPASALWSLAAGISAPIFKGGQLRHQRRAAVAAAQNAAAGYQAVVIAAFQNVSNTLYALHADAEALAAQTMAEHAAAEGLSLVQIQFKSGGASYLQVLAAEQLYQTAAIAQVKARALRYADTAALFQALGGGWWNRADVAADSIDCCKGQL